MNARTESPLTLYEKQCIDACLLKTSKFQKKYNGQTPIQSIIFLREGIHLNFNFWVYSLIGDNNLYILPDPPNVITKLAHPQKTPLYIACEQNKLEVVQQLLKSRLINPNLGFKRDPIIIQEESPLGLVARLGFVEIAKLLTNHLTIDIKLGTFDQQGIWITEISPYYISCQKKQLEIFKILIQTKKFINYGLYRYVEGIRKSSKFKQITPLYYCCNEYLLKFLKEYPNEWFTDIEVNDGWNQNDLVKKSPLWALFQNQDLPMIEFFLINFKHRVDVSIGHSIYSEHENSWSIKETPLHIVSKNLDSTNVEQQKNLKKLLRLLLLQSTVDLNLQDNDDKIGSDYIVGKNPKKNFRIIIQSITKVKIQQRLEQKQKEELLKKQKEEEKKKARTEEEKKKEEQIFRRIQQKREAELKRILAEELKIIEEEQKREEEQRKIDEEIKRRQEQEAKIEILLKQLKEVKESIKTHSNSMNQSIENHSNSVDQSFLNHSKQVSSQFTFHAQTTEKEFIKQDRSIKKKHDIIQNSLKEHHTNIKKNLTMQNNTLKTQHQEVLDKFVEQFKQANDRMDNHQNVMITQLDAHDVNNSNRLKKIRKLLKEQNEGLVFHNDFVQIRFEDLKKSTIDKIEERNEKLRSEISELKEELELSFETIDRSMRRNQRERDLNRMLIVKELEEHDVNLKGHQKKIQNRFNIHDNVLKQRLKNHESKVISEIKKHSKRRNNEDVLKKLEEHHSIIKQELKKSNNDDVLAKLKDHDSSIKEELKKSNNDDILNKLKDHDSSVKKNSDENNRTTGRIEENQNNLNIKLNKLNLKFENHARTLNNLDIDLEKRNEESRKIDEEFKKQMNRIDKKQSGFRTDLNHSIRIINQLDDKQGKILEILQDQKQINLLHESIAELKDELVKDRKLIKEYFSKNANDISNNVIKNTIEIYQKLSQLMIKNKEEEDKKQLVIDEVWIRIKENIETLKELTENFQDLKILKELYIEFNGIYKVHLKEEKQIFKHFFDLDTNVDKRLKEIESTLKKQKHTTSSTELTQFLLMQSEFLSLRRLLTKETRLKKNLESQLKETKTELEDQTEKSDEEIENLEKRVITFENEIAQLKRDKVELSKQIESIGNSIV